MYSAALFHMPPAIETRWASAENTTGAKGAACRNNDGRKRRPCIPVLEPGVTETLLDLNDTSGTIQRFWCTISDLSPKGLRGIRLEMYWDGSPEPAVSAPLGDFFCHGLGRIAAFENALFSSPEARSFNCCVPMPFRTGAKITVTNQTDTPIPYFFYDINLTVNEEHPANVLYFHSHWHRENPTVPPRDYTILPHVTGTGRFLGTCVGASLNTGAYGHTWWGEGEVKIYLDGDGDHPTLCGTGTEDYIGTGWGQGQFANQYQGCPVADDKAFQYAFYRLHLPDPVWFHHDIRVTIQQLGGAFGAQLKQLQPSDAQLSHGKELLAISDMADDSFALFERSDDWSSCAWFYLDRPEGTLPRLAPIVKKLPAIKEPGSVGCP